MNWVEILSIVLAIVALIVTIVGFFASLQFYRDGMKLQDAATKALTKIEEKTQNIQTNVEGMFHRTLDAALGQNPEVSNRLEEAETKLTNVIGELSNLAKINNSNNKNERLIGEIKSQISDIRSKVIDARDSTMALNLTDGQLDLLGALVDRGALNTHEVAKSMNLSENDLVSLAQQLERMGFAQYRDSSSVWMPTSRGISRYSSIEKDSATQ